MIRPTSRPEGCNLPRPVVANARKGRPSLRVSCVTQKQSFAVRDTSTRKCAVAVERIRRQESNLRKGVARIINPFGGDLWLGDRKGEGPTCGVRGGGSAARRQTKSSEREADTSTVAVIEVGLESCRFRFRSSWRKQAQAQKFRKKKMRFLSEIRVWFVVWANACRRGRWPWPKRDMQNWQGPCGSKCKYVCL